MTVLIGLYCNDGVVIGSDSAASFSFGNDRTIEQPVKKIDIIDEKIILASTGAIGKGQQFLKIIEECWSKKEFQDPHKITKTLSSKLISEEFINILQFLRTAQDTNNKMVFENLQFCFKALFFDYGALVAYPIQGKHFLCEFPSKSFQPELKNENCWYVAMGCGQPLADFFFAFLRKTLWKDNSIPNLATGKFVAKWVLDFVIESNTGGIQGPTQIAILEKEPSSKLQHFKARLLDSNADEFKELDNNIVGIEDTIFRYKEVLLGKGKEVIP